MSTARQGVIEELSPTQKAFEFADKLNWFFILNSNVENRTYTINDVLLEYLGVDKYKTFCRNFKETNTGKAKNDKAFFKEDFVENPVDTDDCLTDYEVKLYWQSIDPIAKEVIKLL
jgi:hypothetical protein